MDSGRLLRAVITCVTLAVCLWFLRQLEPRHEPAIIAPADTVKTVPPAPREEVQVVAPPVDVHALPLVALDNTCFYSRGVDVSSCTGAISGGPVREYRLVADSGDAVYVQLEPRSDYYDPSFVLMDATGRCLTGQDEHGPGLRETAVASALAAGTYTLLVSGYAEDCGPYALTVRKDAPPITDVTEAEAHPGRNGTAVRWRTFAEFDLAHFILYRVSAADRERIAIFRAHGRKAGFANYKFLDRAPGAGQTYEIEAVARDGRVEHINVET